MHPPLVNLHQNSRFRSMYTYSGLTGQDSINSRSRYAAHPSLGLMMPPSDKPWNIQIFNSKADSGRPFSQIFLLRRLQCWQDGGVSGINHPGYVCRTDPSGSTAFFCSSFDLKCSGLRNTYVFSVKSDLG